MKVELDGEYDNNSLVRVFGDFKNPPYIEKLNRDYENSKNVHDQVVSKINHWIEAYNAENLKHKNKNRSKTRPKVVKKMAKWTYPSIEEPILAKQDLFQLDPRTFEDAKAAMLNQVVLNYQFNNDIDKIKFVNNATRVLVTQGTLIVKTTWKRKIERVKKIVPVMKDLPVLDKQTGQPQFDEFGEIVLAPQKVGTEIKIVEELVANFPLPVVMDYRKVIIDPNAKGDINNAQFVFNEYQSTLSDLKKNGTFKNLEFITTKSGTKSIADDYNDINKIDSDPDNNISTQDLARRSINVREYWGYWDLNGEGKTDMIVATYVDEIMIGLEVNPLPFSYLPFDICQYEPVFESNYGEPDTETILENQENIGAITRGMIDIMGRTSMGQEGRPMQYLDPINKKKYENGEDYEYNPMSNPRDAFHQHTPPDIPNSIWSLLENQTNEVNEMVGKRPFQIGKINSNSTATAVRSQLDASSKRDLGILRRFTKMMESIAKKMIELNRMFLEDGQIFRITNDKFLAINREHMYGKFDIKIKVTTPEDTENKINKNSFMLQTLGNTIPFDITKVYLAKIAELEEDPVTAEMIRNYQPQPDPLEQQERELKLKLLEAQIEVYRSSIGENNSDAQLNIAKIKEIEAKVDQMDLEFIQNSEGINHERDLEKEQQKINSNIDIETLKHYLGNKQLKNN